VLSLFACTDAGVGRGRQGGKGMDPAARIVTWTFLVATMLSIGMKITPGDLLSSLRDRSLMIRSLAANFVIVPALGLLLVRVVPMSADATVGLLLMGMMAPASRLLLLPKLFSAWILRNKGHRCHGGEGGGGSPHLLPSHFPCVVIP
jgi:predicted permease